MKKTLILAAALLLAMIGIRGGARAEEMTVRFFDIDRNDGILIECGGETAFLDSGVHAYGVRAVDMMRRLGVTKLTYYIGTHAHKDHVGGGSAILAALRPETVLQPHDGVRRRILSCAETDEERAAAESAAYRTVLPGEEISLGGAKLTVLGPLRLREPTKYSDMENNNSLVLRVAFGSRTILLTADAMPEELQEIAERYPESMRCDVLKSPHHNSEPGAELLAKASPRYVVFSTSDKAMPTKTALASVTAAGAVPLITAGKQCGTVTVRTDGENLTVSAENEPERVSFREKEISVYAGSKKNPVPETKPAGYKAVRFESDDPQIAYADGDGAVHGRTPGETVVRASLPGGKSAECRVTVRPVEVTLNIGSAVLKPGETRKLQMTVKPASAKKSVRWESSDPGVATVSGNGMIRAVAPGTATVRLTGPGGAEAACRVTVLESP